MTTVRHYTLITPRADRTGPCNVAVDIGRAAAAAGWRVRLLYLSEGPGRDDLQEFAEVRRIRLSDIFTLRGVVHTHCLRPDLLGWLLRWTTPCHVLSTLHNYFLVDLGFDHAAWKVRLSWLLWVRAIRKHHHRICVSSAMQRYYRRLLPELDFDLAYNFRAALPGPMGKPDNTITAWLQQQSDAGRIKMAYVGSLISRKNLLSLLTAMASAPELSLVVCGTGPLGKQLAEMCDELGLGSRVLLAGRVLAPEAVVAQCDMLVLPSFAEGLPLVALEAARVGRPCLLSNIAVHRELAGLGLGSTFDRHRFSDFRSRAIALAQGDSPARQQMLVQLWKSRFSSVIGFSQYEKLLNAPHTH